MKHLRYNVSRETFFDMPNVIEQTKFITSDGIKTSISANNLTFGNFNNYNEFVNSTGFQEGILLDLSDCFPLPSDLQTKVITLKNNYFIRVEYGYRTGWGNWLCAYFYRPDATLLNRLSFENAGGFNYNLYKCWFYTDGSGKYGRCEIKRNANSNTVSVSDLTSPSNEVTAQYTELINGAIATDDPYQLSPETEPEGGYGEFDYTSDDTDFSRLPALSACDVGFCTLYKMSATDVKSLADYLWGLGSLASFLPIFSDPMECILSLGIVPINPTTGASDLIKVGNLTTTVNGSKITKQFDVLDCGSIELNGGKFSNSFMDYSPYTKAELFLPYIGTVSLDIDEIMDASALHLQYQFDLLSGSCIAELKVTKTYNYKGANHVHENVLYRYSGNILSNIPITGANYTQMYQAIVGAVATGIGGAASAETAKTAAGAEAAQNNASLSNIGASTSMKAGIKRAGNATANCGYLGGQKPELILSLPKLAHLGEAQGKELGFPRYGEYTLSDLTGYTKIMQIHLKSIKCTDEERGLIESALNGGVILSSTAIPTQTATTNTIKVYSYTCDKICLNKADGWSLIDTITGYYRNEAIDVLRPEINIKATNALTDAKILKEANYVYIADFGRYYYIKGMKANAGNIITLSLEVDACMSWLSDIKSEKAIVDRQEKIWSMHLSDGYIKTYNTPYTVVKTFPTGFTSENFILAVAGGGT